MLIATTHKRAILKLYLFAVVSMFVQDLFRANVWFYLGVARRLRYNILSVISSRIAVIKSKNKSVLLKAALLLYLYD